MAGRILVGIDGSAASVRALEWAIDEAVLRGAVVEAVHVWAYPFLAAGPFTTPIDTGDLEQAAAAELEAVLVAVDAAGLATPVERVVVAGNPAHVLIERAEGAALVVVGSRGSGGFAGLRLGSVSHQVTHHSPCPVVVVPAT